MRIMNRMEAIDTHIQIQPQPSQRVRKLKRKGQGMDQIMPSNDIINLELMTNFGGKDLSA